MGIHIKSGFQIMEAWNVHRWTLGTFWGEVPLHLITVQDAASGYVIDHLFTTQSTEDGGPTLRSMFFALHLALQTTHRLPSYLLIDAVTTPFTSAQLRLVGIAVQHTTPAAKARQERLVQAIRHFLSTHENWLKEETGEDRMRDMLGRWLDEGWNKTDIHGSTPFSRFYGELKAAAKRQPRVTPQQLRLLTYVAPEGLNRPDGFYQEGTRDETHHQTREVLVQHRGHAVAGVRAHLHPQTTARQSA